MKEKIKKISKYTMNILAFLNALLIGLAPIWNWSIDKITNTISVVIGLIGVWLVTGKIFQTPTIESDDLVSQNVEMPDYGDDDNDSIQR